MPRNRRYKQAAKGHINFAASTAAPAGHGQTQQGGKPGAAGVPFLAPAAPAGHQVHMALEVGAPDEASTHVLRSLNGVAMFRAGDYGPKGKFTVEDLQEMADTYDPEWLAGPITYDHVQEGKALGWIENVYVDGEVLRGNWSVHPEVFDEMKAGYYTRRSIEIYRGVPYKDGRKVQYVKACSILGAATPEVKGLERIKFNSEVGEFASFDFSETTPPITEQEAAAMPEQNPPAQGSAPQAPAAPAASTFANMTEAQFNERIAQAVAAATEAAEAARVAAEERAQRFATGLSEVNSKLRMSDETTRFNNVATAASQAGRLTIPERDILAHLFHALPFDDAPEAQAATFKASDAGDAPAETITPRALLLRYMENKAKAAPVGEGLQTSPTLAFTPAPQPPPASMADEAKRAEWLDKRAQELYAEAPTKAFGDCLLQAERELANRR